MPTIVSKNDSLYDQIKRKFIKLGLGQKKFLCSLNLTQKKVCTPTIAH